MSGYCPCKCPNCFETAIAGMGETTAFCWECKEAGCDGESDCCVEHEEDCDE